MRESLRLSPTAPLRAIAPLEDTTLSGGKYFVKAGTTIAVQVWMAHRDPAVWGEDVRVQQPLYPLSFLFHIAHALGCVGWRAGRNVPPRKNARREV